MYVTEISIAFNRKSSVTQPPPRCWLRIGCHFEIVIDSWHKVGTKEYFTQKSQNRRSASRVRR